MNTSRSRSNLGGMISRTSIAPGFDDRFGPVFMTGTVDELRARRNVALRPTGYMDRMGRQVFEKITLSPTSASLDLNPLGLPPPPYDAPYDPVVANQMVVGQGTLAHRHEVGRGGRGGHAGHGRGRSHRASSPSFGHLPFHGAHGAPHSPPSHGGGGHHGPERGRDPRWGWSGGFGGGVLYPGGWNQWEDFDTYEVAVCPDGTVRLPDGTCADATELDFHTGQGVVATSTDAIPHHVCCHLAGAPMIRIGQAVTGTGTGATNFFPPAGYEGDNLGNAASTTGTTSSGNPAADAINVQWAALASLVQSNPTTIGPNPMLPLTYSPDVASSSWATDYADWQTYYSQIGTLSLSQITGDNAGWQAYANAWGQYLRTLVPQGTPLPQNFPTGPASPLETVSELLPSTASIVSTLEWIVVAVAIAAGVWLLWPVLAPRLLAM